MMKSRNRRFRAWWLMQKHSLLTPPPKCQLCSFLGLPRSPRPLPHQGLCEAHSGSTCVPSPCHLCSVELTCFTFVLSFPLIIRGHDGFFTLWSFQNEDIQNSGGSPVSGVKAKQLVNTLLIPWRGALDLFFGAARPFIYKNATEHIIPTYETSGGGTVLFGVVGASGVSPASLEHRPPSPCPETSTR